MPHCRDRRAEAVFKQFDGKGKNEALSVKNQYPSDMARFISF